MNDVLDLVSKVAGVVAAFIALDTWWRERVRKRSYLAPPANVEAPLNWAGRDEAPRILWRWALMGVAAAIAVGSYLGWRWNSASAGVRTVGVASTRDWTDTRVDCEAGYVLEISATGVIYHNATMHNGVGPEGDPDHALRKYNLPDLRNANHAGLIGRIDRRRPYFLVGKQKTYRCPAKGGLFLGINDIGVDNNRGQFVATIRQRAVAG